MAKKNLSEDEIKYIVTAETSKAQQRLHELSKEEQQLTAVNRTRLKMMIELEAQGKKNSQQYKELQRSYNRTREHISSIKDETASLTRQLDVNAMSMVQLRKQAKDLKRELDNTAQALEPERYAQLEGELKKVNLRMTELKERANEVAKSSSNVSQAEIFKGVVWARLAEMGTNAFTSLISGIKDLAAEGVEMAQAADGVTHAFRQLDDGHILDNLRKATKGTVTDLDLMKAAVQAKDFRIPLEDLGKYLQFAQLKAQQTGQSVEYMTNSIVTGLGRKSVMILDNLGISASEVNEQIKQGAEFTQAVANIVDKQLAAAGESYESAADRASAASVRLKNRQMELGRELLPVAEKITDAYNGIKVTLLEFLTFLVRNKGVVEAVSILFSGLAAATLLANVRLTEYIATSKASVVVTKLWGSVAATARAAALLFAAGMATLRGNTTRATAAMKLFNTTCKGNLIGFAVSAVLALGTTFLSMGSSADSATDSLKDANAELMNEQRALSDTFDALKKAGEGTDERRRLIDEINQKYGEYMPNLLSEKSSLDEIEAAYRNVNNAMVANIALKYKKQEADAATEEAAQRQTDALEAIRQRVLQVSGATQQNAVDAQSAVRSMTATYQQAGVTWQKAFNSIYDSINAQFFGGKGLGSKASEELQSYVKSYYQMRKDIKAIDDKYAVWQQSSATSGATTTSTTTTSTTSTENKKETIKQQVVDEQKARQEALQQELENENELYYRQQMQLRDAYLSSNNEHLQTQEQYNQQLQMLEQMHLQRMLELSGLSADQRRQILAQLADFSIKCLNDQRAANEQYNRQQQADREKREQETNASNERITQKEQEEYRRRIATYRQYGQQLGDAMGKVISGQEDMLSAFADTAIDMVFEVIEKVVEAKILEATATATTSVAKATAESFATTDSVLTFGASGAARAAVMSALIMGALAAAKSALKGMLRGSKSSSSSSSSSASKVTRSQVTATGRESGGTVDVRRRQDGRLFSGADYDPSRRGFIDRPTVIVGEGPAGHSKEWVASNAAVSNPTVAPLLQYLDQAQQAGTIRTLDLNRVIRARLAGFSGGGAVRHTERSFPSPASADKSHGDTLDRLAAAIETLNSQGVRADVVLTDLERKQQLRQQSRQIASK